MQRRHDKPSAKKFFRKLLKSLQYIPRVIIMDKLDSYNAAKAEVMPSVEHRRHKGLNNRVENSHQSTRLRASDEEVQISRTRAKVSLRLRDDLIALLI